MRSYICFSLLLLVCNLVSAQEVTLEPETSPSTVCPKRNGYYMKEGSCDAYMECREFAPTQQICPDGMNYNPQAVWPEYPCGYPMDVPCLDRGVPQPALPTEDCPHQYGMFPSLMATPAQCGGYRMCVRGRAVEMACPIGLAFNSAIGRCDWPEFAPGCDVDAFFGFKCPAPSLGADGKPLSSLVNIYSYEGECMYFFSCEKGRARLLSCDHGLAFDAAFGKCVDANLVRCTLQQRNV